MMKYVIMQTFCRTVPRWAAVLVFGLVGCSSSAGDPPDQSADGSVIDVSGTDTQIADDAVDMTLDTNPGEGLTDVAVDQAQDDAQVDFPLPSEFRGGVRIIQDFGESGPAWARVEVEFWATPMPTTQVPVQKSGECVLLIGETMNQWDCTPECTWGNPGMHPQTVCRLPGSDARWGCETEGPQHEGRRLYPDSGPQCRRHVRRVPGGVGVVVRAGRPDFA